MDKPIEPPSGNADGRPQEEGCRVAFLTTDVAITVAHGAKPVGSATMSIESTLRGPMK